MYVYIQSESAPRVFTVGFYTPKGTWHSESDHSSVKEAAARVAYLNGSPDMRFDRSVNEALNTGNGKYTP